MIPSAEVSSSWAPTSTTFPFNVIPAVAVVGISRQTASKIAPIRCIIVRPLPNPHPDCDCPWSRIAHGADSRAYGPSARRSLDTARLYLHPEAPEGIALRPYTILRQRDLNARNGLAGLRITDIASQDLALDGCFTGPLAFVDTVACNQRPGGSATRSGRGRTAPSRRRHELSDRQNGISEPRCPARSPRSKTS